MGNLNQNLIDNQKIEPSILSEKAKNDEINRERYRERLDKLLVLIIVEIKKFNKQASLREYPFHKEIREILPLAENLHEKLMSEPNLLANITGNNHAVHVLGNFDPVISTFRKIMNNEPISDKLFDCFTKKAFETREYLEDIIDDDDKIRLELETENGYKMNLPREQSIH
jgi:hypothetical protein